MIERFFLYSSDHQKPIRLFIMPAESHRPVCKNVIVLSWNENEVHFVPNHRTEKRGKEQTLPRELVLSADYARGDNGDPLQFDTGDKHEQNHSKYQGNME